jgi:2-polyprenyl-6-hydroxyphenyl methylase / 3-demethylubiquinone-9 3-methyltransferase
MVHASDATVDIGEVERFAAQASAWWDTEGSLRALHRLNPVRLGFIRLRLLSHFGRDPSLLRPFTGLSLLDIGCGGGIVAEPMARLGFAVTGVDPGSEAIAAAKEHARGSRLNIEYRVATAESLADAGERFDAVLALEVIEHLADRDAFWRSVGRLMAPDGAFIAATINRTARSFALAIVGAEYLLGWIPRGTHDWRRFLRPSEMILGLRRNRVQATEIAGLSYDIGSGGWMLSRDIEVNYLLMASRGESSPAISRRSAGSKGSGQI